MGQFGINLKMNFENVKLDKLYTDASKVKPTKVTISTEGNGQNYNLGTANKYGGISSTETETMDMGENITDSKKANETINVNNSSKDNVTVSSAKEKINNYEQQKINTQSSETVDSNNNVNKSNTINSVNKSSTETLNQSSNFNNNSTSSASVDTKLNNSSTSASINKDNIKTNISQNANLQKNIEINNKNVKTSLNSKNISASASQSTSATNVNLGGSNTTNSNIQNNGIGINFDMEKNVSSDSEMKSSIEQATSVTTTTANVARTNNLVEDDIDNYEQVLKSFGISDNDINSILNGQITPEQLLEQIENEDDSTRRVNLMYASYLKSYGLEYNSIEELKKEINNNKVDLNNLYKQKIEANNHELDTIMGFVSRLMIGESLENILSSSIVAWEYVDELGNTNYVYEDPYSRSYDGKTNYVPLTFEQMYEDSELLNELKNILTTRSSSIFKKQKAHYWNNTKSQVDFINELSIQYEEFKNTREINLKEIDESINTLENQIKTAESIYNNILKEVNYYINNVDVYVHSSDFAKKNGFNDKALDTLNNISEKYKNMTMTNYNSVPTITISKKEEIVDVVCCMINDQSNGYIFGEKEIFQLSSSDNMVDHFRKWISLMTTQEKEVFNYIYNTSSADEAYNYLKNLSLQLDERWLKNKTEEDTEYATLHPVLSSLGSIVITPVEGISALYYSLNAFLTNEKIMRTDVHSSGDTWRFTVAQNIAENSNVLSFIYSTGMSMADSLALIGINAMTGGVAAPVISATTMGSRAYVSTLNDALDRGLSDGEAISLAFSSSVIETAMESYSVSHLFNLEENLGENVLVLKNKIAENISNKKIANIISNGFYATASAVSQALVEGEEEFSTEILNYVTDIFIAKDLSNFSKSIEQYLANGCTENEALLNTMKDFNSQAFQAFLGGFVSGVCFGAFSGVKTVVESNKKIASDMYKNLEGITVPKIKERVESNLIQTEESIEQLQVLEENSANDPKINQVLEYFVEDAEYLKGLIPHRAEMLDKQRDYLRNKVIKYTSIDDLLNDFDNIKDDIVLIKNITNPKSPIIKDILSNDKFIDYIRTHKSNNEIIEYANVDPDNEIVINALLNVSEVNLNVLKKLKYFPTDIKEKFIDINIEYFKKMIEKNSTYDFNNVLDNETAALILDKLGDKDAFVKYASVILKAPKNIRDAFFNKYQTEITQEEFIKMAEEVKDPDTQTEFIKSSPFYKEIISSSKFSTLLMNLKSKELILELIENPDAYNKLINSSSSFRNFMELLDVNEQEKYKEDVKNKIISLKESNLETRKIVSDIEYYIGGFDKSIQLELLNDLDIINSFSDKILVELNNKFSGCYSEIIINKMNENFDEETAKMIFEPSIYSLMSQDMINMAAMKLPSYDYKKLIELGNQEAINKVIDKMIGNNFKDPYGSIVSDLYKATDEIHKQQIRANIPISVLISDISSSRDGTLTDLLVERLNKPEVVPLYVKSLHDITTFCKEDYDKVYKYLSDKQKLATFIYYHMENIDTDNLLKTFRQNPNAISYMTDSGAAYFLNLLTEENDIKLYYDNLSLDKVRQFTDDQLKKLDKNIMKEKIINNQYNFKDIRSVHNISKLFSIFNEEEQLEILNSFEISDRYKLLISGELKAKAIKLETIKLLINDPYFKENIGGDFISEFKSFFDKLELDLIDYVLNNANGDFLGYMLSHTKRNDLNAIFYEMIKNNTFVLNRFDISDAELIYENLSKENRELLDTEINNLFSKINNSKVSILLEDATLSQKSKFIEQYNKGMFDDEKLDFILELKEKNKFVLSSINYSIFDETIYKFSKPILTKLSKYSGVVDQIVELKQSPKKFNLFAWFILNDSSNSIVADQKMAMLLDYLLKNDVDPVLFDVTNIEELKTAKNIILKNINQFSILKSYTEEVVKNRSIIVPEDFTLQNYYEKLAQRCDALLEEAKTVADVQNLIFNKYYSMSIEDAQELFRAYGSNFATIKSLDTDAIATTYLENLQYILDISTIEEAKDFYNSFDEITRYSMEDNLNIMNEIKQLYTKSLKDVLFKPEKITGYVTYKNKQIPIYEPSDDFHLLIQSTSTDYGAMPIINNSYYDSWNLSSKTSNHGICCSLISNSNMGMARVKDNGIVIGFNSFSDEQINMMAPYDIYSVNDNYLIKCMRPFKFLPGSEVMNETRHTHNEFNLERTNLTGEGNLANIQPDYVVVFEEMPEFQKLNAYKASLEFSAPLVYINKSSLAQRESVKIDNLIVDYQKTKNVRLLRDILISHENNRSGYRNPTDLELVIKYFPSQRISSVFEEAIENCKTKEELEYIRYILTDEVRKFDVTLESVGRVNEIDIDVDALIKRIDLRIENLFNDTMKLNIGNAIKNIFSPNSNNNEYANNPNLTKDQIKFIEQVNGIIRKGKDVKINLRDTKTVTSTMLEYIDDLSKLSVRMDLALTDFKGKFMDKYNSDKYLQRVTYTGGETYNILKKIEQLEARINKNLPITLRAKQIYDLISSEIRVMYEIRQGDDYALVAQSLRGVVSNNNVGKQGLVCAGYSSLFRELCERCNIKSDYIRGLGVIDGRAEKHAWNVFIDEFNRPIPVDITWRASSGADSWFGGSELFQSTHIADSDEKFKLYLNSPAEITVQDKENILNNIVKTMDTYCGENSGINTLKDYLVTGNKDNFILQNGVRDTLKYLSSDDIKNYINSHLSKSLNKNEMLENIISTMHQYYGPGSGFKSLKDYLSSGNVAKITRQNNARQSLNYLSTDDIMSYINEKRDTINHIIAAINERYGKDMGITVLKEYVKSGNTALITRQNNARRDIQSLTIAEIKDYLNIE